MLNYIAPKTALNEQKTENVDELLARIMIRRNDLFYFSDDPADIFEWWRSIAAQFPDLARLARIFHSIPATSICSERLFSKAGFIYADTLRNRHNLLKFLL